MKTLDLIVLEEAIQWLNQQQPVWLCTVLHTYGSAPRSPGALFVATADGQYAGSLSGGCIEEDFLKQIGQQHFLLDSQVISYGQGGADYRPNVNLPCGGSIDVLVEYLQPTAAIITYLQKMHTALLGKASLQKIVQLGEPAKLHDYAQALPQLIVREHDCIRMNLQSNITVLIAAISMVAMYCIEFASALGFSVIVCEDRDEELRQIQNSSLADKITLIEAFPATYLETHGCTAQTAILSLTHDPRIDDLTMIAACETPAFYIGAMGSKANSENRLARIRECTDFSEDILQRVRAPIGLDIGSKTPAEIALAIMADIVSVKNNKGLKNF